MHSEPLAYRLRPKSLDEFVGQEDIVGPGTPLRSSIEKDTLQSVILAGPPGTGKTTLAHIIAQSTQAQFVQLNAVMSGVKELKAICLQAEELQTNLQQRTVLFVDEIHRFNKAQQDALLPFVERGIVILIGATTANPYFEVNSAILSRSHVCLLTPLLQKHLLTILKRALGHEQGYAGKITIQEDALKHLARIANGDARIALNTLELSILTIGKRISLEQAEKLFNARTHRYDKTEEDHYNIISAFIKSMRGSDVDAALVWLFMMIEGGEDPRFLFRRMLIFASEDIGNADPQALQLVTSAWQSFELVGVPEGEFFLAHACIYLSQAPKSNAIKKAMYGAKTFVQQSPQLEVPPHLRNAPVKAMRAHGIGQGYQYPHDAEEGIVAAEYFPLRAKPQNFYMPTDRGYEQQIRERMKKIRSILRNTPVSATSPLPLGEG